MQIMSPLDMALTAYGGIGALVCICTWRANRGLERWDDKSSGVVNGVFWFPLGVAVVVAVLWGWADRLKGRKS